MSGAALSLLIVCTKCSEPKVLADFYVRPNGRRDGACRTCLSKRHAEYAQEKPAVVRRANRRWYVEHASEYNRQRRENDPRRFMLVQARQRAEKKGIVFLISEADIVIPEFCPVLGLRLSMRQGHADDRSPSLDRVVPSAGYVPGNVCVISMRANQLKSNGTLEEHEALVRWLRARREER